VDIPQFEIDTNAGRVTLNARYDHPAGDLQRGNLRFNVDSSAIDFAKIENVQKMRPGIGGTLQLSARGAATVQQGNPRVLFSDLNADVAARGLSSQGKNFGDLTASARTGAGQNLDFKLDSNFAGASIHGSGAAQLRGDYPINAN